MNASPSAPNMLAGFMKEIGQRSAGWHALVVRLSQLPVGTKRTELSTQIVERVEGSMSAPHGTLILPNRDVLALVRDPSGSCLVNASGCANEILEAAGLGQNRLVREFHLETELSLFIAMVSGVDGTVAQPKPKPMSAAPAAGASKLSWSVEEDSIPPKELAKAEKMFFKANIANFLRNQTSYHLVTDFELEESHDEIFISIDYLTKVFANTQVHRDKWLFQYFTRTLDSRLLASLGSEGERKEIAYSINLNLSTLFSEAFLIYDRAVPARVRRGQIIEIQAFDLVENAQELAFIRSFLNSRGYRLCIDGLDQHLFMMMDWSQDAADILKFRWSPDLVEQPLPGFAAKAGALSAAGKASLALCRCDDERALDWGKSVGVTSYQGWYLDGLRKPRASDEPKRRYILRDRDLVY